MSKHDTKYTIIIGTPIEGFWLYGIFKESEDAVTYATKHLDGFHWWVTNIVQD